MPKTASVTFETECSVRFADCDPAGIVFFPQYLVMLNTLIERWFDEGLGVRYATLIGERRTGLPTARLEVDFTAVSRHGDRLRQSVGVLSLGRSSVKINAMFHGGTAEAPELRMQARQVLVCTSLDTHRPQPLPDDVREALARYMEPGKAGPVPR